MAYKQEDEKITAEDIHDIFSLKYIYDRLKLTPHLCLAPSNEKLWFRLDRSELKISIFGLLKPIFSITSIGFHPLLLVVSLFLQCEKYTLLPCESWTPFSILCQMFKK